MMKTQLEKAPQHASNVCMTRTMGHHLIISGDREAPLIEVTYFQVLRI